MSAPFMFTQRRQTSCADVLYGIVDKRGAENDEMQGEVNGMAKLSKLPVKFVQAPLR